MTTPRRLQQANTSKLCGPTSARSGLIKGFLRGKDVELVSVLGANVPMSWTVKLNIQAPSQARADSEQADTGDLHRVLRWYKYKYKKDRFSLGLVVANAVKGTRQLVLFPGPEDPVLQWHVTGKSADTLSCFGLHEAFFLDKNRVALTQLLHDLSQQTWFQDVLHPYPSQPPSYILTKQVRYAVDNFQADDDEQQPDAELVQPGVENPEDEVHDDEQQPDAELVQPGVENPEDEVHDDDDDDDENYQADNEQDQSVDMSQRAEELAQAQALMIKQDNERQFNLVEKQLRRESSATDPWAGLTPCDPCPGSEVKIESADDVDEGQQVSEFDSSFEARFMSSSYTAKPGDTWFRRVPTIDWTRYGLDDQQSSGPDTTINSSFEDQTKPEVKAEPADEGHEISE